MRTSQRILDSASRSTTRQKHSRDETRAIHGICTIPRPLSRPHHLLGRLTSYGELARTRTAASERSQSRLTSHGTRDDTRHRSCDMSRQQARTHALALAPSCTRLCSWSAPTPRSRSSPLRPPTLAYSPICPPRSSRSLEPPEEHGQHSRGSSRGWSPEASRLPT